MEKKGYALLSDPFQNKGTAFRADERVQFGLTGLLPPHIDTIAEQAQRIYQQMERKSSGIEKRRFLMDVFNRNRRLFYYVFRQHIAELMPVATNARPSDQRMRSSAVASASSVGLLSGKMIGRSHHDAIARTIVSVNAPGIVDVPTRMVGFTAITAAVSVVSESAWSNSLRFRANGFAPRQVAHVVK